ncbi:MAG: DUF4013 domain-containing protein [Candidatus Coatesbacteria bacterium]|nr:DUF4013 domain-containing protein [Candidatus Coatesbacteria bacterium]
MDVKESLTYVTRDKDWIIKVLMSFIPIVNIGILMRIIRNVALEKEYPIPSTSEISDLFREGLTGFLAMFLLMFVIAIPMTILIILFSGLGILLGIIGSQADASASIMVMIVFYILVSLFSILYSFFMNIIAPVIWIRISLVKEFGQVFAFAQLLKFTRENFGHLFKIALYSFGLIFAAWFVAMLTMGLGLFILQPLLMFAMYHLYGQLLRITGGFDDLRLEDII